MFLIFSFILRLLFFVLKQLEKNEIIFAINKIVSTNVSLNIYEGIPAFYISLSLHFDRKVMRLQRLH